MSRLAILCSGQGAQSATMLARFDDPCSLRLIEERLSRLPAEIAAVIRGQDEAAFQRGEVVQPALCLYSELAWKSLGSLLPEPSLILGYSLGELIAHAVAGALPWEELPQLAMDRGRIMAAASRVPSRLVAVSGLDRDAIESICFRLGGAIAIRNGGKNFVIGIDQAGTAAFCEAAMSAGAKGCRILEVEVASHTPFMDSAVVPFLDRLGTCDWRPWKTAVLSATSSELVKSPEEAKELLARQLAEPLNWCNSEQLAVERGVSLFLELGPGSMLSRMVQKLHLEADARSLSDFRSMAAAAQWCVNQLRN